MRIWLIHSLLFTASGLVQEESPSSSSSPTPFSQSRCPLNADESSIVFTFDRPLAAAAPSTVLSIVGSIVELA